MDCTKSYDIPRMLPFIDFEKAFDNLDWSYMFKCLEVFRFGPSLIWWVETFYNKMSSCISTIEHSQQILK